MTKTGNEHQQPEQEGQPTPAPDTLSRVWDFFGRTRVAIFLLLLWAALSTIGTIVPQDPMPPLHTRWGGTGRVLEAVGFDNMFHSLGYLLVLILVCISIFVCSVNRTRRVWRLTVQPQVTTRPEHIGVLSQPRVFATVTDPDAVEKALRGCGLRVFRAQGEGDGVSFLARTGWISRWGAVLLHWSLLVVFLGALIGKSPRLGALEGQMRIADGQTEDHYTVTGGKARGTGQPLPFAIHSSKFIVEVKMDNPTEPQPTKYASDLEVIDHEKVVLRKTIQVNDPLSYQGIRFSQASFEPAGVYFSVERPGQSAERLLFSLEGNEPVKIPGGSGWALVVTDFYTDAIMIDGKPHEISNFPIRPVARLLATKSEPIVVVARDAHGHKAEITFGGVFEPQDIPFPSTKEWQVFVHDTKPSEDKSPGEVRLYVRTSREGDITDWKDLGWLKVSGTPARHQDVTFSVASVPGESIERDLGWLGKGQNEFKELAGVRVRLAGVQEATVLGVRRDPGLWVVYAAFALATLGVCLTFYVRDKAIRAYVEKQNGRMRVHLGGTGKWDNARLEACLARVETALSQKRGKG